MRGKTLFAAVQPKLKPLLIVLVKTHPERLQAGLSLSELSEQTNYSEDSIRRHVKALRALGLIETKRPKDGRGNKYSFWLSPMAFSIANRD